MGIHRGIKGRGGIAHQNFPFSLGCSSKNISFPLGRSGASWRSRSRCPPLLHCHNGWEWAVGDFPYLTMLVTILFLLWYLKIVPLILLPLLRKQLILGRYTVSKWRRSWGWVGCSTEAIPKNIGQRRGFEILALIIMMHPCGFGESFQMLCIGSFRLDVSMRNLKNLPFFSGCCQWRFSVVSQWSWVWPGRWIPQCERRTGCCPPRLGFSWSCPWRLWGVHLGVAGHSNIFRIYLGRWHMVSVAVVGVFHACMFESLF